MANNIVGKVVLLSAVIIFVTMVVLSHFTWSVDGAEIILKNGDTYKGKLSNSGFSQYKVETETGIFYVDKTMVESTSWGVASK